MVSPRHGHFRPGLFPCRIPTPLRLRPALDGRHVAIASSGRLLAVGGKTLQALLRGGWRARTAIRWSALGAAEPRRCWGKSRSVTKATRITAIPRLPWRSWTSQQRVFSDHRHAMGCQKNIAAEIVTGQGHYLLAVENSGSSSRDRSCPVEAITSGWEHTGHSFHREVEADHGQIRNHRCWATWDAGWFRACQGLAGFASIVCVESLQEVMGGKTTCHFSPTPSLRQP